MIELTHVKKPNIEENIYPVFLSDETMKERKDAILNRMKENDLDSIVVWADLEHGNNFEYLVGFLPRFEEALLVLHKDGIAEIVLGNENLNKASKSRIPVTPVHMPHFSLPNQPMKTEIDSSLRLMMASRKTPSINLLIIFIGTRRKFRRLSGKTLKIHIAEIFQKAIMTVPTIISR